MSMILLYPQKTIFLVSIAASLLMAHPPSEDQSDLHKPISRREYQLAATAYVQVAQINEHLQKSLKKADTDKEKAALQGKANDSMVGAVNDAGLSIKRYNLIITRVVESDSLSVEFEKIVDAL
ncbi:MAG: DUF4168 domain-containing protein [Chitinivibrionales bacterium]